MREIAARALLATAAVALAVWVGLGLREQNFEADGTRLAELGGARPSPDDTVRADALLRRAAELTRSTRPEVRRAELAAFTGRPAQAAAILRSVVAREPENADAWRLLAQALRPLDPAAAAAARRRYDALSPPVPAG